MDWEKWVKGKTPKEIEAKIEELGIGLNSPRGIAAYEMMLQYSQKFRPDLYEEFIKLEHEITTIQDSTALTDEEKEVKSEDVFMRLNSVLDKTVSDMEMRERPVS